MKDDDVEIGQHCWATGNNQLQVVLKTGDGDNYEVCGAWECGISVDKLELIEVIEKPAGHEKTELYYMPFNKYKT